MVSNESAVEWKYVGNIFFIPTGEYPRDVLSETVGNMLCSEVVFIELVGDEAISDAGLVQQPGSIGLFYLCHNVTKVVLLSEKEHTVQLNLYPIRGITFDMHAGIAIFTLMQTENCINMPEILLIDLTFASLHSLQLINESYFVTHG